MSRTGIASTGFAPRRKILQPAWPSRRTSRESVISRKAASRSPATRARVFLVVLHDPLFLRLTHVRGGRIAILVVRADLKVDEPERVEGRRLDDGHVLRRLDGRTGDV